MTKVELWEIYVRKNPSFEGTAPITLSPAGIKKLFDETWRIAEENCEMLGGDKLRAGAYADILSDLFSKNKR